MPDSKPMILLASADARGELPALHEEVNRLDALFQGLKGRGIDYLHLPYAKLEGISRALLTHRHRIAIFHYAGHADAGRLMLEAALGSADGSAHAEGLAGLLGSQRGLKLVFLNGCSTLPQVDLLRNAGVPAVIATSRAINDLVARDFAITFYEALTTGREGGGLRPGQSIAEAFASTENFVKARYSASPEALNRDLTTKAEDVREVTKGLPWLLRPSTGEQVLRWGLFEDDPLFGLPRLPDKIAVPQVPVRRLEWFRRDDARIFFGRGRAIRTLYDAVTGRSGAPIVLYYGATGAGKSSVLHAGLMPRLEADHDVIYVRREPARGLLSTLRDVLSIDPEANLLVRWRAREQDSGKPLILILDQLEEAFTRPQSGTTPSAELAALAEAIRGLDLAAERPRGKLILGFRKEWLQEVEQALAAVTLTEEMVTKVPLDPMDGKDIREAVAGPARDEDLRRETGLEVDDDLPGLIAHYLLSDEDARAAIAPTLQTILSQLWDQVKDRSPRRYTVDLYHALQGEGLLLRDFLKRQLEALKISHSTEVEKGFALELLEAHTTAWGTANRRSRRSLAERFRNQSERLPLLLQQFKDLYLLVDPPADPAAVRDSRVETDPETSLAHDALAPLVQEKQRASSAPAQRARRLLENRAGEWKDDKDGTPLDTVDLETVESGAPWMHVPTPHEARLIGASRESERSRREAEARRTAREQRNVRLRNGLGIAAGIGLLIASIAAWGFWDQRDQAVKVNKKLGDQVLETKKANEKLGEQIKATNRANEDLGKQIVIAETQTKKAVHEARVALVRLQHSALSDVESLARTDPLRAQAILQDAQVFPPDDRDFAWGYHLGLCDWFRTIDAHQHGVACLAYSADRRTLATGGKDGKLRLWEASTGQPRGQPIDAHQRGVACLAYGADGRTLATGGNDGKLRLWEASTGQPRGQPIDTDQSSVYCLAYSIDGRTLATGGFPGRLQLWEASTGQPRGQPIYAHQDGVACLAYSIDGRTLATGGKDGKLRLWEASTGQPRGQPIDSHPGGVWCLAYSIDGRTLATGGSDGKLRLWEASTGQPRGQPIDAHQRQLLCLAYSADGRTLATASNDGKLRLWEASTGQPRGQPIHAHQDGVKCLAYGADGRTLATGGWEGKLRLWEASTGQPRGQPIDVSERGLVCLAYSADGRTLATAENGAGVRLWEADTGRPRGEPIDAQDEGGVACLAYSADGRTLATGQWGGKLRLWEVSTGQPRGQPIDVSKRGVTCVAYGAGDRILATGDSDGKLRLWEASTGRPRGQPIDAHRPRQYTDVHKGGVACLAYGAGGRTLATGGSDGKLRLWEADTGRPRGEPIDAHPGGVWCLAYSIDGRTLASGGDGKLRLWEASTGQPRGGPIDANQRRVNCLAYSADGRTLVTGGNDGKLRLWEADTGQPRGQPIDAHQRGVNCLAYSIDGRTLATGGSDGKLRFWKAVFSTTDSGTSVLPWLAGN